ncbi:hypothetical protein C8Q72DRAFT_917712, partial [Fomitopsis betulina]
YIFVLALLSVGTQERVRSLAAKHLTMVLLVIWGLYVYRDVWPLATFTLTPKDNAEGVLLWARIGLLTIASIVVPLCIPRPYIPINPEESIVANPEQTASILSLMLYAWLDNTVWKAFRQGHAKQDDLPPLADYDHAKNLVMRGIPHLDPFKTPKRRHFFWGLTLIFWRDYVVLAVMIALRVRSILPLGGPLGVNRLLNYLEHGGEGMTVRPWVWVLLLFLGPTATAFALQWYIYTVTTVSVRMRAIITQLVFEHALRIQMKADTAETKPMPSTPGKGPEVASPAEPTTEEHDAVAPVTGVEEAEIASTEDDDTLQGSPGGASNLVGRINNLVTTDLQMLENGRDFIALLVEVPTTIAFSTWFLYVVLGWSAFVGMAVMVALLPLPSYIASFIHGLQVKKMATTDARVQTVTEMLGVVRMIKLFGWEPRVVNKVAEQRREELRYIRQVRMRQFLMSYVNYLIPVITMVVTYGTYVMWPQTRLDVHSYFTSVFETIRNQIQMTFGLVPMMIQAKVSTDRFDEFLHETELLDEFSDTADVAAESLGHAPADSVIGMRHAAFTWTAADEIKMTFAPSRRVFTLLIEEDLTFKRGCLNLVLGPTGSGKTSLLMALLGEVHYIPNGPGSYVNLPRSGGVAYAAQESWVQNETIKDNILFGSLFDAERYEKVIEQCGLRRDLELLDDGDLTEVGEKGLTLSGGQKARITLARAIYSPAEILLLDDVLAALDVHTSQWIVNKCFNGDLVRGRTIILVTHNIAVVRPIAGFVVTLGTDGCVHSQGSLKSALEADNNLAFELTEQAKDAKAEGIVEGLSLQTTNPERESKLIVKEEVSSGQVSWAAFKLFLGSLGGQRPVIFWLTYLGMYAACETISTLQIWFLGLWTRQYDLMPPEMVPVAMYITLYSLGQGLAVVFLSTSYLIYVFGALRASKVIHSNLILSVFGTTLRWLDTTPVSRIITRCTQDIQAIDNQFVDWCFSWMQHSGMVTTKLGAVVVMSPLMLVPGSIVFVLGALCGFLYINAQLS